MTEVSAWAGIFSDDDLYSADSTYTLLRQPHRKELNLKF